jgi:hypothetical protein
VHEERLTAPGRLNEAETPLVFLSRDRALEAHACNGEL